MVFIVMRHGQSIWNKHHLLTGYVNVGLTSLGKEEAYRSAQILKKYNFDYIFTSTLSRAIETGEIIKSELNQKLITKRSCALNERNYGILTGMDKTKLVYKLNTYYGRPHKGENLADVQERVGFYYDNNIYPLIVFNKNILVVSHSNTLKSLFVHLGLKDKVSIENFEINNCMPIQIDLIKKKFIELSTF